MADLSAVYMSPEPKDSLTTAGEIINPVSDTLYLNCKKIELRSDHVMIKIDTDKLNGFKYILINGRKYVLQEEK